MNRNAVTQVITSQPDAPSAPSAPRHLWVVPQPAPDAPEPAAPMGGVPAGAWQRLLGFLAQGRSDQGAAYERTRARLVEFFTGRGILNAEELADATFDRLLAKLTDADVLAVRSPLGYALRFAHFIYLETVKAEVAHRQRLDSVEPSDPDSAEAALVERQHLQLVQQGLDELDATDRLLLLSYYEHTGRDRINSRQELCRTLGLNPALLRTRVSRLRAQLERRVRALALGEAAAI
jgi:hypothetical protein